MKSKYKVCEYRDVNGETIYFTIVYRWLFVWFGGWRRYETKEEAQKNCDKMNGYKVIHK